MNTKLRCAVLDDYQNVALTSADWSPLMDQVEIQTFNNYMGSEEKVIQELQDFDIVVLMRERTPFPEKVISQLPKLKLLITSGMRNASIDLKAAEKNGIIVCGTEGSSNPPTELTWALILGLSRQLVTENNALRSNRNWQSTVGLDLHGRTLGLLGLGKIGTRMAEIAQAFGMNVMAWSENLTQEKAEKHGVIWSETKEQLLAQSDIVSIHLVLSDRTRNLIGQAEFQLMKSSALLINTSRAGIVDQEAMVEALQSGVIAGAGLDVYEQEPLPVNHVMRTLPNVLATPHLGYVTRGNYEIYYDHTVENIAMFLKGTPIRQLLS
ncbi:D-2-hydroxyacid dehydrogenase family protein [Paenibacillus polymyxa]|uniref:D-2-hydroxyacid dehydrogenase family protein n=1 Tax=Paenibacillus TaxID=44249 RepID=UPI00201E6244|nr:MULTISPECIES: D-2-hydroxyacid dehydrogenase family protein [Paenibacillus]MCL6659028.1 D-2-hydroxyacid dehydrogenase family protein [Paenibacillus amylolyticus]UOK65960.1 D-2-hydroxyacid dehydrogenase family protein [Paenibacillus sp. OVF10]WJM10767.1 D-2-hydroxyacid dehydrogenase family protein [Paenibacillus sp. PK1-4R]